MFNFYMILFEYNLNFLKKKNKKWRVILFGKKSVVLNFLYSYNRIQTKQKFR